MNVPEWMYVGDIVNQLEMELIIGNGRRGCGAGSSRTLPGVYPKRGESIPSLREGNTTRSALSARRYQEVVQAVEPTACIRNFST